jgi:cystathionine beta-synthase
MTDVAPTFPNVLEAIGNTPMVEVQRLDTGPCRMFLKLESQNPAGSIKDRIGKSMIEAAERDGSLKPGGWLIEATAGNTGLGLALVASQKGYKLTLIVPDKMAQEKIFHLKALGVEVLLTRSDVGKGHPEYYQDMAERIAGETGAFYVNQFANPANPEAHYRTTGPEIWEQLDQQVDAVICGVGSGGTIAGLSRFFEEVSPSTEMILADPEGSVLAHYVETGELAEEVGSWVVEGIGEDFMPPNADNLRRVKKAYVIPDAEALHAARELLAVEGLLAGSSSGTLLAAALRYCREQDEPKRVCTFVCDSGNKYLSKMFNDYWMVDQGFIEREKTGDLRDLISRPHAEHGTVVVAPQDDLLIAYGRMKLYEISQLPVLDPGGGVVGIIDESDILHRVVGDQSRFRDKVESAMTAKLETIGIDQPLERLLPIFDEGRVAIVTEDGRFHGLITRIDLLNHLRRKLK